MIHVISNWFFRPLFYLLISKRTKGRIIVQNDGNDDEKKLRRRNNCHWTLMELSRIVLWFYPKRRKIYSYTYTIFSHFVEISIWVWFIQKVNKTETENNIMVIATLISLVSTIQKQGWKRINKPSKQQTRKSSSFHVSTKQSSWWSFSPIFIRFYMIFL